MEAEVYPRGGELRGIVQGTKGHANDDGTWAAQGVSPHVDSPRLSLTIDDRHTLVVRMMYAGPARTGRALFRTGGHTFDCVLPCALGTRRVLVYTDERLFACAIVSIHFSGSAAMQDLGRTDHKLAPWINRPNATAVRWSQGSQHPAHLCDGDVHTGWTAAADEDGWVVLDLGGHFPVSELDMVVTFAPNAATGQADANTAPQSLRLQVGDAPDTTAFKTVFAFHVDRSNNATNATTGQSKDRYAGRQRAAEAGKGDATGDMNPRYTAWFDAENGATFGDQVNLGAGLGAGDGTGTFNFKGFNAYGRYFRLFAADNFGAAKIEVNQLVLV
jgi:hypothetical protein